MNRVVARTFLLTFLLAGVAAAQNSDLAFLLGATGPYSVTRMGGDVSKSFGVGFQANYAAQLHETPAGQLYLELPLMFAVEFKDTLTSYLVANSTGSIFFTPGARWRFTPQKRMSFYAAGGIGVGSFEIERIPAPADASKRTTTLAFGFGGGIDFRLTRLLSLRAEGRDFVTPLGIGTSREHSHAFFMAGIGFHF
jgi:opacity protein-like surface antigen